MDPTSSDRVAVDLSGSWTAAPADDDRRREAVGAGHDATSHDTTGWHDVEVPGHWRTHPAFTDRDGPLLYRRSFTAMPPDVGRRRWVRFEGIFYQADVWLDGAYLGDPEGYFAPHTFEITELSRAGNDHVLAVEVSCPPPAQRHRVVIGAYQSDSGPTATWNPGGIWAPVRVEDTGPVRVDRFRALCRDADAARAHVLLHANLDADEGRTVTVRTSVDGEVVSEAERPLAAGSNELDWSVDIEHPRLWWPRALGDQPLTRIGIEVLADDEPSDRAERCTGLREVAWNRWTCAVNGERLFLKGATVLPTRLDPANATATEVRRDVELAAAAGLDVLRVHGHVARPELYAAADELGILLIQDFPLSGRYERNVRGQAVEQARAAVDLLGHHPSIAMWIAHDDPTDEDIGQTSRSTGVVRRIAGQQLPSWNRSVLDRWVKRTFEKSDSTRPCVPHSGVAPHLPQLDGTDSHLTLGWRTGDIDDLARLARRVPRLVRFVSELGAQSVPDGPLPPLDDAPWPDVSDAATALGAEMDAFDLRVPPDDFDDLDAWRRATQTYQAELVRRHVETLRRIKYRPTGGFCVHALNDPAPAVSFAVLDHQRRPKPAYEALRRACAPVVVIADPPPPVVASGDRLEMAVHVVSDLRHDLADGTVVARAHWNGGERTWRLGGDVPADGCVRAGRIGFDVPETLGTLTVELTFTADGIVADNRYTTLVTVGPDDSSPPTG